MGLQKAIPMQISGHYSEIQVNFALSVHAAAVNFILFYSVLIPVILIAFGTLLLLQRLKYSYKLNVLGITNNINKLFV